MLGLRLKTSGASYIPTDSMFILAPTEIGGWEGLQHPKQFKTQTEKGKNKTEITRLLESAKCNVSTVLSCWASRGRAVQVTPFLATMGVFTETE